MGRFHEVDSQAFSVAAMAGYTFVKAAFRPRLFVGFDIASGGDPNHPGDTFDQLFPSGHDQFGIIDAIGRQNIIDVHPGVNLTLVKNKSWADAVTVLLQYRQFWRESTQDAIYSSAGTVQRQSGGSNARSIGGEVDLQVNWQIDRYLGMYAGYGHFFHGPFISQTGASDDIDFAYTAVTLTF